MLCRALIIGVAVTYLMCVLLLSGMQKEDLEVSMLTKLQRHNVNINDMNNEELLQKCVQSGNDNSKGNITNVTVSPPLAAKIKSDVLEQISPKSAVEISQYKENNVPNNASNIYKPIQTFDANENQALPKISNDNKLKNDEAIQFTNNQPKLESVLKFWQNLGKNIASKAIEPIQKPVMKVQENKKSVTENVHSTETDAMNRLLAAFITRGGNLSPSTTTQQPIHIQELYKNFDVIRIKEKDTNNVNYRLDSSYLPPYQNTWRMATLQDENIKNGSQKRSQKQNILINRNLSDVINLLNRFQHNPFNYNSDSEVNNNFDKKTIETLKLFGNPFHDGVQTPKRIDATINEKTNREISQNMIKEIAESVKEIVLRDLRKELHEKSLFSTITTTIMTTTATQSTTKTESTTMVPKKEKGNAQAVMNKFLELFEEIKSMKQSNMLVINQNKEETNDQKHRENLINKDFNINQHVTAPDVIPNVPSSPPPKLSLFYNNQIYRTKNQYPIASSENIFNFAPQVHKFRSNGPVIKKQEPVKGLLPITVQTNNIEIPPLSIPIDRSQSLINQNIIISTTAPYRIIANKKETLHKGSKHPKVSIISDDFTLKQLPPHSSKESYSPSQHSNYKDDVIRFTLSNNAHSKYNNDYYEKISLGKYNPHLDNAPHENKHHNIPRYHEKLEKVGRYRDYPEHKEYADKFDCCDEKMGYSEAMVDCCNRKIASRQQMSLNNMKKDAYDDTHFKNFLQSQQKVTDMLEKILADKGSVQSVATV